MILLLQYPLLLVPGIGIIRMSGDKAFEIAYKVYKGKKIKDMKSHTINYGKIIDPTDGSVIDEVLLSKMDNPHTFTREDVIGLIVIVVLLY